MITDYQAMRGPMFNEDCGCHCSAERNQFQSALDEINEDIKDARANIATAQEAISNTAGWLAVTTATNATDTGIEEVRGELARAAEALAGLVNDLQAIQDEADKR